MNRQDRKDLFTVIAWFVWIGGGTLHWTSRGSAGWGWVIFIGGFVLVMIGPGVISDLMR